MVFLKNCLEESVGYLCEYIPQKVDGIHDSRSVNLVLAFKNNQSPAIIDKVAKMLLPQIGKDFVMIGMPSSVAGPNTNSGPINLINRVISLAPNKNIKNASECLFRYVKKEQSCRGGSREADYIRSTLRLKNIEKFQGQDVLIVDDVYTTGNSMRVAMAMLKEAGAKSVYGFVVGRTRPDENFKYGFIFDLDMTLFDTSSLVQYRNSRDWPTAILKGKTLQPMDGVGSLMNQIKALHNYDICIVSNSPEQYVRSFAERLGIKKVVAYHDTSRHKPDIMPYAKAKELLEIYEPCITVFGDQEDDITPGIKMGMNTVMVSSDMKVLNESNARFRCHKMEAAASAFSKIIEPITDLRTKLVWRG